MKSLWLNRLDVSAGLVGYCFALCFVGNAVGQDTEILPPGNNAPSVVQAEDDSTMEVLNRGPIHEAFASPGSNAPVQSPVIAKQPPELIEELPPEEKPDGDNIEWIPGYWAFDDDLEDFIWISGVWRDVPPDRRWVPGYWASVPGGFQWIAGAWIEDDADEIQYLPPPPPTQERGPSSPQPSAEHFYVPGTWVYADSSYRWRTGYWTQYHTDWVWVPARYIMTPAGCVYVSGYWDYPLEHRGLLYAPTYFHGAPVRAYRPVVVVNSWQTLFIHLFVRPSHSHYMFGNYYGPTYVNQGVVSWQQFNRTHAGYDPFYTFCGWRYGNSFHSRCNEWHNFYNTNPNLRPLATVREQTLVIQRQPEPLRAASLTLNAHDIHRLPNSAITLTKLDAPEFDRYRSHRDQHHSLTTLRTKTELDPKLAIVGAAAVGVAAGAAIANSNNQAVTTGKQAPIGALNLKGVAPPIASTTNKVIVPDSPDHGKERGGKRRRSNEPNQTNSAQTGETPNGNKNVKVPDGVKTPPIVNLPGKNPVGANTPPAKVETPKVDATAKSSDVTNEAGGGATSGRGKSRKPVQPLDSTVPNLPPDLKSKIKNLDPTPSTDPNANNGRSPISGDRDTNRSKAMEKLRTKILSGESGGVRDGKPGDGKPGDGKPGDGKPGDGKPRDGKVGDGKSGDRSTNSTGKPTNSTIPTINGQGTTTPPTNTGRPRTANSNPGVGGGTGTTGKGSEPTVKSNPPPTVNGGTSGTPINSMPKTNTPPKTNPAPTQPSNPPRTNPPANNPPKSNPPANNPPANNPPKVNPPANNPPANNPPKVNPPANNPPRNNPPRNNPPVMNNPPKGNPPANTPSSNGGRGKKEKDKGK